MGSRYAAVHQSSKGPGDARPTAHQIIDDENLHDKLPGKTILITGCSSGLGVHTAQALYKTGATLYLTARDLTKARTALGAAMVDSPQVHLLHLDLNSLASVRACADEFKAKSPSLNILIANAGVMACPEARTIDGFETQFGNNHLAHFLLFHLLKPLLLTSATPECNSRVVIVSSGAHRFFNGVRLDNLSMQGEYIMRSIIEFETLVFHRHALRDLHPRNIMLAETGDIVFMDFGDTWLPSTNKSTANKFRYLGNRWASPILRWHEARTSAFRKHEFHEWIDWDWQPWLETEFQHTASSITPELQERFLSERVLERYDRSK